MTGGKELIKRQSLADLAMPSPDTLQELSRQYKTFGDFQKILDGSPEKKYIKLNKLVKMGDGSHPKFLPIDIVEAELNRIFHGLWNCDITETRIVINEIVVAVSLEVFNPFARIWLRRSGIGAAQIRMKKGSDITDINNKLRTAVSADAPHALSEAIKNAAKRFGKKFGGGINREDKALDYEDFDALLIDEVDMGTIEEELNKCETSGQVKEIFKSYPSYHENPIFRKMIIDRGKELPR